MLWKIYLNNLLKDSLIMEEKPLELPQQLIIIRLKIKVDLEIFPQLV
jgi:hypothetical protein